MNVLIFVMTMLMVLAMLTYARLETFRNSQVVEPLLVKYMMKEEKRYINQAAEVVYDSIKVSTKAGGAKGSAVAATSRINITLLLDPEKRDGKPHEWQQTQQLLTRLIDYLYQEQPFYDTLKVTHPQFVEEIIGELAAVIAAQDKDKRPKEPKDLALIKLPDPKLDEAFYKMLHGAPCANPPVEENKSELIEEEESDEQELADSSTFHSSEGYCSILDFVNRSAYYKIRVYLAPKPVLGAVFGDDQVINSILLQRKELHQRAMKGEDLKGLSNTFKELFDSYRNGAIDSDMIDYSVTKTNPKNN